LPLVAPNKGGKNFPKEPTPRLNHTGLGDQPPQKHRVKKSCKENRALGHQTLKTPRNKPQMGVQKTTSQFRAPVAPTFGNNRWNGIPSGEKPKLPKGYLVFFQDPCLPASFGSMYNQEGYDY